MGQGPKPRACRYLAVSMTLIAIPYHYRHPLGEIALPRLREGNIALNAGQWMGLPGTLALLPLIVLMSAGLFAALHRIPPGDGSADDGVSIAESAKQ